jgi:hypothetical protein
MCYKFARPATPDLRVKTLSTRRQSVQSLRRAKSNVMFIDESGDPGLKLGAGSSKYFIVTLVAFEDDEEALAADTRIEMLKTELGFSSNFEFHFNNLKPAHRKTFLNAVAPYNFFYFGIVINKRKLRGPGFHFKESFYKYACGLVFENAKPRLHNATVIIDGSGSKDFRKQLSTYLKRKVRDVGSGNCEIKKVKIQDSRSNNLLQLADMICGSVARCYSGKAEARECRELVAHREIYVQFWPK